MSTLLNTFVRTVPQWHKSASKDMHPNTRPATSIVDSHCYHCQDHNPLYRGLASPSFSTGDVSGQGGTGLDALYKLCVCDHAVDFGPLSEVKCADPNEACSHGCGPLLSGHERRPKEEKKRADVDDDDDGEEQKEIDQGVEAGASKVHSESQATVDARREAQMRHDCGTRGVWPLPAGSAGCPVLEAPGSATWREYQCKFHHFVDRTGTHREKKAQVLVEVKGTRQQFLATFKRKLLQWLPHKRHLLWDAHWQKNTLVCDESCSERIRQMRPGQVDVRVDFIKNAEVRIASVHPQSIS